jgi:hypothetical protein
MKQQELARETVETIRRIEAWGRQEGLTLPRTFAVDLGEAYRSARILVESIDSGILSTAPTRNAPAALARLQAWTYDDLIHHLERLRGPLEQVVKELHDKQSANHPSEE